MRMTPPNYAIILTHNRPALLPRCVVAVTPQVDAVLVIDNASDPPVAMQVLAEAVGENLNDRLVLIHIADQPPNLSVLWNCGFWHAAQLAADTEKAGAAIAWNLIMLCDDAIIPDGWVQLVTTGMREHGAAAACTGMVSQPLLKTAPDNDLFRRMPGHAFTLAGEANLAADERLHWWWMDTDLDWQARLASGMVMLPGPIVINERPNDFTNQRPELAERAGVDRQQFATKWGSAPW